MIAAVNLKDKVVWGFGQTVEAAKKDAALEMSQKEPGVVWPNEIEELIYIPLIEGSDLRDDGYGLYQYLDPDWKMPEQKTVIQESLF